MLGITLILIFGLTLRWLPSGGFVSPFTDLGQNLRYMVLPTLTLELRVRRHPEPRPQVEPAQRAADVLRADRARQGALRAAGAGPARAPQRPDPARQRLRDRGGASLRRGGRHRNDLFAAGRRPAARRVHPGSGLSGDPGGRDLYGGRRAASSTCSSTCRTRGSTRASRMIESPAARGAIAAGSAAVAAGRSRWRRFARNRPLAVGTCLTAAVVLMALLGAVPRALRSARDPRGPYARGSQPGTFRSGRTISAATT